MKFIQLKPKSFEGSDLIIYHGGKEHRYGNPCDKCAQIIMENPYLNQALEARIKENISQLRQWLNEDRIDDPKKMVTNEELEIWLSQKGEE